MHTHAYLYTCTYPYIFPALSKVERELFRELIRQLDRKINPGLNKLTWNTEYVDAYIEDCFNETANVRSLLPLSFSPPLAPTWPVGYRLEEAADTAVKKFMRRALSPGSVPLRN